MKHPLTRTMIARWLEPEGGPARYLATSRSNAAPSGDHSLSQKLRDEMAQARHLETNALIDHAVGLIRGPDGGYLMAQAGSALGAIFGRKLLGTPFGWLFREADRADVAHVLRAAEEDGLACILSADIPLMQGELLSFEAALMGRGSGQTSSLALSGVIAPFAAPAAGDIRSPFLHLRSSRFVTRDEAMPPAAAIGRPAPRWTVHQSGGATALNNQRARTSSIL